MLKANDYFVAESKRGAIRSIYGQISIKETHCLNISFDSLRKSIIARDESKSMEFQEN
jgi:hypothetical protein